MQVSIDRLHFPVVPAEAIAIHKSQGATYSRVVVSLGQFNPPREIQASDPVYIELQKLRGEKKLQIHHQFLFERTPGNTLTYYHNIQGFYNHRLDIANDIYICSADILCFVESWTREDRDYSIDGYEI